MRLILFRERPLSRALAEFSAHYHAERNHQGKGNQLLLPEPGHIPQQRDRSVECRQEVYSSTMAASHEFFDLTGTDPVGYLSSGALMLAIGAVASARPALRAARADPMQTLRAE